MEMVVSDREMMKEQAFEAESGVRVVLVAGVTSGAGKTSLAEALAGWLSKRLRTAAAKITVTHGERGCPHGGKGCDVCGSLGGDYQVIDRISILSQEGTDTARLLKAGADPVLWAITREQFVADAWRRMASLMKGRECAVVESNTLALVTRPAQLLMVVDPSVSRRLWKPSAEGLIKRADAIIFNDRGAEERRRALLDEIERLRGTIRGVLFVAHPHDVLNREPFTARLEAALRHSAHQ